MGYNDKEDIDREGLKKLKRMMSVKGSKMKVKWQ